MGWKEKGKSQENKTDKVKEITTKLEDEVKSLFESEKYKNYLQVMSRFTNYSFYNTLLIALQRPTTMAVASYNNWQKLFQRNVVAGSKGIAILQPIPYKTKVQEPAMDMYGNLLKDNYGQDIMIEKEISQVRFKVGYVFAYEDTTGDPLPEIVSVLNSKVSGYEELMSILEMISPVPIYYKEIDSKANGYFSPSEQCICIRDSLPQLQKIKTILHEIAHSLTACTIEADRNEHEILAESTAYTVCSYLGYDTSDYSLGYVGGWSKGKELSELKTHMELIRKTSHTIITKIEEEIKKREITESENLGLYNNTGFLTIEKIESGYKWELYNNHYSLVVNGEVKDKTLKIEDAVNEVMSLIGSNVDSWSLHNYNRIKQKAQEQVQNIKDENKKISERQMEKDSVNEKHYKKRG